MDWLLIFSCLFPFLRLRLGLLFPSLEDTRLERLCISRAGLSISISNFLFKSFSLSSYCTLFLWSRNKVDSSSFRVERSRNKTLRPSSNSLITHSSFTSPPTIPHRSQSSHPLPFFYLLAIHNVAHYLLAIIAHHITSFGMPYSLMS